MSELLCKECKHSRWRPWHALTYRCYKTLVPAKVRADVVTGPVVEPAYYDSCFGQRFDGENRCGKAGKFWEPKNKKGLFKLIKKEVY